ncbi:MAG: hypothetical protein QOF48_2043 [Verrucomicrobiota bacterium]|jgi:hypothetical protein
MASKTEDQKRRPILFPRIAACLLFLWALPALAALEGGPVIASVARGFHKSPFSLTLAAGRDGTSVRYTLDGSAPSLTNGTNYVGPFSITNTTLLRAAVFREGRRVSRITTHSYLFLDQILRQPESPHGLPAGSESWNGLPPAYRMDARVVNDPAYRDRILEAFESLPVVSITCAPEALFGTRGLYLNTTQHGEAWEKECSAEFILEDGSTGFQMDCGLRIQGGMNRIPNRSPKHSFRLVFKEKYGDAKLRYPVFPDSAVRNFDTLVLRADYNNSWVHWDAAARPRAQRTRDAWMKDSHRAMGWVAPHNRYVHLFLDGLYWGVYDFTERPDAHFAAAYFGGKPEDFDVVNESVAKDGTLDRFSELNSLRNLSTRSSYEKLQRLLDVTEYIDYLLLNYFAGNQDWGETKNWYAIRRRTPGGLFQFVVWDGEQLLHDVNEDTVSDPYETPFRIANELRGNPEFCLAFADRARKALFGDGALTPAACIDRWMQRARQVDPAVIAESARWGYFRRRTPYTRDREWMNEQQRLLTNYFPRRTEIVLGQLRAVGLYPTIDAPLIEERLDGNLPARRIALNSPRGDPIYFTTNGVDPRVPMSGEVHSDARRYTHPVEVTGAMSIKARVLRKQSWSALTVWAPQKDPRKPL